MRLEGGLNRHNIGIPIGFTASENEVIRSYVQIVLPHP